jgi:hypothetical protein
MRKFDEKFKKRPLESSVLKLTYFHQCSIEALGSHPRTFGTENE